MVKLTHKKQPRRRSLRLADKPKNASSPNSHEVQPATPPYPVSLSEMGDIRYEDDKWVFRQPKRRNTYNPEGLSLDAIDCELVHAKETQGQCAQFRNLTIRDLRIITTAGPAMRRDFPSPTPEYLIQPDDAQLINLIKGAPLLLLQSPDIQDALGRWTFAARWSHDPATRKQASAFLARCRPKKKGNPGKTELDLAQLLLAYDDLCNYCKCIFACADAVKTKALLLQCFPDATRLAVHGLKLDDILNPRYKKPAPSEISSSYAGAFIGLSSSRIMDKVTEARSAIALSQKT